LCRRETLAERGEGILETGRRKLALKNLEKLQEKLDHIVY
jgi:hypothetical protein